MKSKRIYKPTLSGDSDYIAYKASLASSNAARTDLDLAIIDRLFEGLGLAPLIPTAERDFTDVERITALIDQAFTKVATTDIEQDLLARVWDWLSESDREQSTDVAFILGGGSGKARAATAASLFTRGLVGQVITTGRGPHYQLASEIELTEAEETAHELELAGVPTQRIVIEKTSTNTMENVIYARRILEAAGALPASVTLITVPYHMRRGALTFVASAGNWQPKIVRQPCASRYNALTWFAELGSFKTICLEYVKLAQAQDMGHF